MRPQIQLLLLQKFPIYHQLQIEEALLRSDQRNWCILNQGTPPAIVMGISGKTNQWINESLLQSKPLPVIRRFSGGGTVVVDENTIFATFIFNADEIQVPCCPEKIMRWTEGIYRPLLGPRFQIKNNDYALDSRKFGGNAQHLCKNRWLHHTSLLWDYFESRMEYLPLPPRMPAYREMRSHSDFLCRLREHLTSSDQIGDHIIQELNKNFEIKRQNLDAALKITEMPHRKATELLF